MTNQRKTQIWGSCVPCSVDTAFGTDGHSNADYLTGTAGGNYNDNLYFLGTLPIILSDITAPGWLSVQVSADRINITGAIPPGAPNVDLSYTVSNACGSVDVSYTIVIS